MLMIYQNWLLAVTKIQILKITHNYNSRTHIYRKIVGSHKDTNFESNSQELAMACLSISRCWKSQRYKF